MEDVFETIAGMGTLVALLIIAAGIAIAALLLMLAFRGVMGYRPSYPRSMAAVVLMAIASAAVLGVIPGRGGSGRLLGIVVQFLVGAVLVRLLLPSNTGDRIAYGKACLVLLVYTALELVLGLVVAGALFGVGNASMHR